MPAAPFILMAASAAVGTIRDITAVSARKRQQSAQAAFLQSQAERARAINDARDRQLLRSQSRERAAGRARQTSSGLDPLAGSPLLLQENVGLNEFDRLLARSIGLQSSIQADQQSHLLRMQAASDKQQEMLSVISSEFSKAASFASGPQKKGS